MKEITGIIVDETRRAYQVDIGKKASKLVWIPKKVIENLEQDYLYPEMSIFALPDWFPILPQPKEKLPF